MNWKLKAIIQNTIHSLPQTLAYNLYYKMQRNFGGFRKISPGKDFEKSIIIAKYIIEQNHNLIGKSFIEVGTGWTVNVPIGLWLCGASKIITVDINRYLKEELIIESMNWIDNNSNEVRSIFGELLLVERLDSLLSIGFDTQSLLKLTNIEYLAPGDAACLPIESNTVNYHFSVNVLEHIPPDILKSIFSEAKRVLMNDNGLLVHIIDLSDHFSHSDSSITSVNFLKFTEKRWNKWGGNRFMYHNRLRTYDYYELFDHQDIDILLKKEIVDNRALELLKKGFSLDKQFIGHNPEELSVSKLHLVGKFSGKN